MSKRKILDDAVVEITKELTDKGKLIQAGFTLYTHYVIPKDASSTQVAECLFAYMAGAEHLFDSIMNIMEPGEEPTEADMRRMDLIHNKIEEWRAKLWERTQPTQGRA